MPGTNIWSVVFCFVTALVALVIVVPLISMWRRWFKHVDVALEKNVPAPSPVGPGFVTILTVGIFIVAVTLGWNAMVNVTTSTSNYINPAEAQEHKKVQESQLPSNEELDKTRDEQRQRQQVSPHKKAIDSFDESMKREEERIKQRNK